MLIDLGCTANACACGVCTTGSGHHLYCLLCTHQCESKHTLLCAAWWGWLRRCSRLSIWCVQCTPTPDTGCVMHTPDAQASAVRAHMPHAMTVDASTGALVAVPCSILPVRLACRQAKLCGLICFVSHNTSLSNQAGTAPQRTQSYSPTGMWLGGMFRAAWYHAVAACDVEVLRLA
jgi:hypothetical protein